MHAIIYLAMMKLSRIKPVYFVIEMYVNIQDHWNIRIYFLFVKVHLKLGMSRRYTLSLRVWVR